MADGTIALDEPAVTDKLLDTESLTVGVNTVQRERMRIAGLAATDLAEVTAANGLDVDVTRLPALVAGTANIGDVDVLTVPAPLSTQGGGTEATALRVTIASDSTGLVSVDDNGGSLTVDGSVTTSETPPAAVLNGNRNVTTAGTRVTLTAGSTPAKSVTIKAKIANTGLIYVGDTAVAAANGFQLNPGESVSLDVANLQTINLDSAVSGEGVTYLGVN